jgi:hypothetical protein
MGVAAGLLSTDAVISGLTHRNYCGDYLKVAVIVEPIIICAYDAEIIRPPATRLARFALAE